MKTLTFSTLYPNHAQPRHGIFVEQRLRHLLGSGEVESRVVAPAPWFPFRQAMFGRYGTFARIPPVEERHGIRVLHPRFLLVPKVGMTASPALLAMAMRPVFARLLDEGFDFDVIDTHYLYPEGVAAVLLGRMFQRPVVMSALGDDVITLPRFALPRRMILWAVEQAGAVTSVCQALKDELVAVGAPEEKVRVILHGVDLDLFHPTDREAVRRRLGLTGTVLLSVGHVTPRKGHHLALAALPELPGTTLMIAGDGWLEGRLRAQAESLGVSERVRFLGQVEQEELKDLYSAADALVLASSREGIANVLLESMACGTPVVATPVWGTPEVVNVPEAGVLMRERSAEAVVEGVRRLLARYPDREATRRHAARFSWEQTSREHLEALHAAVDGAGRGRARAAARRSQGERSRIAGEVRAGGEN